MIERINAGAIAQVDMRSVSAEELKKIEAHLMKCAEAALSEENAWTRARGKNVKVKLVKELVGDRPFGETSSAHLLVRTVREELARAGFSPRLGWSSTDSNAPMAMGIPAVTLSFGGTASGVHGRNETYNATGRLKELEAIRQALFRIAAKP